LFNQLNEIGETLLKWIEENTTKEINNLFTEKLSGMVRNSDNTMMRMINYPAISKDEDIGSIRAAAHGDINFLTMLVASTKPGLQVKSLDNDWIDIKCDPGAIIVNIGDMLERASNGYYPSTIHRVINPKGKDRRVNRMSMPLFLHARPEVEFHDGETVGEFLNQRILDIGISKK
jgi:isopenicillin N synthase-like dioxygenase